MSEQVDYTPEFDPGTSRQFLWDWKDIALVSISAMVILIGCAVGLTIMYQRITGIVIQIENAPLEYYALLAVLEAIALTAGVLVFGLLRRRFPWSSVGISRTSLRWLTAASISAMIAIPAAGATAALVQMLMNRPIESPQMDFILPENFSWTGAAVMLLGAGALVPIAEELFFRGLIYNWMRQGLSAWIAILLNAALFGLVHGEPAVSVATGLLGALLAWFYERSRSLWPSIVIHILVNSVQLVTVYVLAAAGSI